MTKNGFWRSTLASTIFISCIVFLLFFRGHWAMRVYWPSDEGCYASRLGTWIGMHVDGACRFESNYFAFGAPFLWTPAGLLGKIIATLRHVAPEIWVVPLLALWSYMFWALALHQLSLFVEETGVLSSLGLRRSSLLALGVILCIPALYYSTDRNMMSHSAELLASIVAIRLIDRELWTRAVFWCILLFATRYNDAPVFLMLAGKLLDSRPKALSRRERAVLGVGIAGIAIVAGWISLFRGYSTVTLVTLIREMGWEGVRSFWISPAFGMLWFGPWLVAALALGLYHWRRNSWCARGACLWIAAEFFLGMGWNGNGSDFGYRYLIGSYAAGIYLWFTILRVKAGGIAIPRLFKTLTVANSVLLTYILIVYKTILGTGPHSLSMRYYNPDLLMNFLKMPWTHPEAFRIAFYQQIPIATLYISYLWPGTNLAQKLGVFRANRVVLVWATVAALGYSGVYLVRHVMDRGRRKSAGEVPT